MLNEKVVIDKIIAHDWNVPRFSKVKTVCNNAVRQSQGISDTFSTGSQNQKPPHPNS